MVCVVLRGGEEREERRGRRGRRGRGEGRG